MTLNLTEVRSQLASFDGWEIGVDYISKTYVFSDFFEAINFVNLVAGEAIKLDHHPDIDIRFNKVNITLHTDSEGGITNQDIALAKEIERLKVTS